MKRIILVLAAASLLALGCASQPGNDVSDGEQNPAEQGAAALCKAGRDYDGFGGEKVALERPDGAFGDDHNRIKPLSALQSEYTRVLGAAPESLAKQGDSIGKPDPRFYAEPQAGAVALYSLYLVSFDGCASTLSSGPFAAAPTMDSAKTQCHALGRKFWSRTLSDKEADACAKLAVEALPGDQPPARRWANLCATLLTSAGFLSY